MADATPASLTIGRLARAAGVGVETIRYYQQRALLPVPLQPDGRGRQPTGHQAQGLAPQRQQVPRAKGKLRGSSPPSERLP